MIVPTSIMTWYSGTQILGNSEQVIAESSLAGLESNRSLNEMALNYISQDTVRLASSNMFDGVRPFKTFDELNAEYRHVENALSLQKELQSLIRSNDGVYSAYFHLAESDYIVSSDQGIILLDRYESIDWIEEALHKKDGIAGVWYPREMQSGDMVLSYILPLNRLSTSTKGTIVVNLIEKQIAQYMNTSNSQDNSYFLIDTSNNRIISHEAKELLQKDANSIPFIAELLQQKKHSGYIFRETEAGRYLYTWSQSNSSEWLYANVYSMDKLMSQTQVVQRNIIILTAAIILIGTGLAVFLATWLSKPARELVRSIRARSDLTLSGKNELAFLDTAFQKMQEEEDKLNKLITEQEQDACSLAIHQMLKGDALDRKRKEHLQEIFPGKYFYIAMISLDQYSKYVNQTSPETRSYHQYLFTSNYETQLPHGLNIRSVYYGEGRIVLVINSGDAEKEHLEKLKQILEVMKDTACEIFGHTVTIGVSGLTESTVMIPDKLLEAMELIKNRMIAGNGQIIFGKQEAVNNKKYIYPIDSERRILNFLDTGDFDHIQAELTVIHNQIESAEYISYDNILFIYNQLVGVTIKHLNEKNINTSAMFANQENVYSAIASIETLGELESYLRALFRGISKHMHTSTNDCNYVEQILGFLDEHFKTEIVFEDMAKEIGISYSYMRKLVYDLTGNSLIDYINSKRIQKAKGLLMESTLNITQIATEVGYNNIQSFNRFFRKIEGVTPSSYKSSKLND